jgi:CPA2 family monovalent cation:H+ antiporter-2
MTPETAVHAPPYLREAVLFLIAGLVAAPLCRRLKVSPVIGYLVAGVLVGPGGFQLVSDPDGVRDIAELGVIFLLFAIGLELSFARLKALRKYIVGLGGVQMLATIAAVGIIALAWGNAPEAALVLGVCFAFSSTAVAMQLLAERGETASGAGRTAFAILLMQDIAVAPALILVEVLGQSEAGAAALLSGAAVAVAKALAAVVVIVVLGRVVFSRLFKLIVSERSPELFMAAVILTALATAWTTNQAGLSTALGAFLAGVLLAETEFRAQIETDIEPFKGLLLGLFFMGVGMSLDPRVLLRDPVFILLAVAGLALLKATIIFAAARAFGRSNGEAARVSGLLAQAGEFAFVVVGGALVFGVLDAGVAQFMAVVVALSMLASPGFDAVGRRIGRWFEAREAEDAGAAAGEELENHVVVAGYGRVGRIIGRALTSQDAPWIAVDRSASTVAEARKRGEPVVFGDAARLELLHKAGLDRAAAVVVALDDAAASARAVASVRQRRPNVPVIVRARDEASAEHLTRLGATAIAHESYQPALQLAETALNAIGAPETSVRSLAEALLAASEPSRSA